MGRRPKGFQPNTSKKQTQPLVKPKKLHEIQHITDKNSRTISKICQLLEIIQKHGTTKDGNDENIVAVQQKIDKLRYRLNRRLIKLAKWSDIPQDERIPLEFRYHKLGTLKSFGPVEFVPLNPNNFRSQQPALPRPALPSVSQFIPQQKAIDIMAAASSSSLPLPSSSAGSILPQPMKPPNWTMPSKAIIPSPGCTHLPSSGITLSSQKVASSTHSMLGSINSASAALKSLTSQSGPLSSPFGSSLGAAAVPLAGTVSGSLKPSSTSIAIPVTSLSAGTMPSTMKQETPITDSTEEVERTDDLHADEGRDELELQEEDVREVYEETADVDEVNAADQQSHVREEKRGGDQEDKANGMEGGEEYVPVDENADLENDDVNEEVGMSIAQADAEAGMYEQNDEGYMEGANEE